MVGTPGLLADLDVEEIFTLAHFGARLAMTWVLGEAKFQQPVRIPIELFEVRRLTQLILRSTTMLAIETVARDKAADTAHGDLGPRTGGRKQALGVTVALGCSPGSARRI